MPTHIETLTSYVPTLIARRLAYDQTPISKPSSERFPAAVLFADISGFTMLTERLAQRGPAGIEELTQLLKTYFGHLIELITAHGGDVVKFAGDALLALWPTPTEIASEGLIAATCQAAQCALAIQQQLNEYQAGTGIRLSLKLAVGSGKVLAVHLGGVYNRWEFLVTGKPVTQVSLAERFAQPGDVVLSPQAWALVRDNAVGHALAAESIRLETILQTHPSPGVCAAPNLPCEAKAGLQAYIPGAIVNRLTAGQSGWLAELRRITVIFVNLPDLDHTTPLDQAQTITRALQKALYRFEGSINKLSVDDKGVTLVAALGLPPLAHEDDAVRGVCAAQAMQTELSRLGLRSAIGVTTGRAFCGSIGNATRREYTMIGDVVNLAARLMQATGKELPEWRTDVEKNVGCAETPILCDETTFQAAQTNLAFKSLSSIKVKGKAEPVAIYHPLGQREQIVHQRTEMVGRTEEKAVLAEALRALLRGGPGATIIIEGEAGIGKSRLVEDLLRQVDAVSLNTLIGAGDAIEKSTSYHAWRSVFRQLFNLETPAGSADAGLHQTTNQLSETRRTQILAQLEAIGPDLSLRAPLLNTVLPLDLPDNELTTQMTGEVRADNINDLLVCLLQAHVAEAHKVLIMEDAHWLDTASWALLRLVCQDVRPLLLVIVSRPFSGPALSAYNQLLNASGTQHLKLTALPLKDTLTLVCRRLGVTVLPRPVANFILEKAEGHPFFSEELACALRDANLIEIKNDECHLAPGVNDLGELEFPDTIEGVITSRVDHLTPRQQLILKVASVIGRIFAFRVLRDIHPIETDKPFLQDYLGVLERLDLTPLETPEPELAYIFKHIITQEVAYNLMTFAQRQKLHQATAKWFENSYAKDLSPFYPLLAYHWSKAVSERQLEPTLAAKAIDYLEKAGEQALDNFANQEAVEFFSQAVTLDDTLENPNNQLRQACWERQLGDAHNGLGNLTQSLKHYEKALTLLGRPIPKRQVGWIVGISNQMTRQALQRLWPARFIGKKHDRPPLFEAVRVYEGLFRLFYLMGELVPFLYVSLAGLNLAERAKPSPELARGYAIMGTTCGNIPLHALARAYGRWGLKTAQRVNDLSTTAWVVELIGLYNLGIGQWPVAQNMLGQAVEISKKLGYYRIAEETGCLLAITNYHQGNHDISKQLFAEAYNTAHRRNDPQPQIWGLIGQLENDIWLTEIECCSLTKLTNEVENLLTRNPYPAEHIRARGVLGRAYLRRGELQLAQQHAQKALEAISTATFIEPYSFEGYAGAVEVYLALWEANNGQSSSECKVITKSAHQACKALGAYARVFPIAQPRSQLWWGLYYWLAGKPRKAHKAWQKSLIRAEQLAMPHEQGLAHYQIGRHLPLDDPKRKEQLTRACEIFTRLKAVYDLERAREALDEEK